MSNERRLPLAPATCNAVRTRILDAARGLVSQCGPNVTLSEVAHHAREAGAGQQRSIGDDAIVEALLEQRLGDLVDAVRGADAPHRPRTSARDDTWTGAVREILSGELDRPAISLRDAARTLAVSVRTLQRRLIDEGTTWRAEVDAARKERAAQLLAQGATTALTAAQVGYSGSRALRRALRRWGRESD
jgi:AraC-like DNA-binding protein